MQISAATARPIDRGWRVWSDGRTTMAGSHAAPRRTRGIELER
jgi:hypothetical protein